MTQDLTNCFLLHGSLVLRQSICEKCCNSWKGKQMPQIGSEEYWRVTGKILESKRLAVTLTGIQEKTLLIKYVVVNAWETNNSIQKQPLGLCFFSTQLLYVWACLTNFTVCLKQFLPCHSLE